MRTTFHILTLAAALGLASCAGDAYVAQPPPPVGLNNTQPGAAAPHETRPFGEATREKLGAGAVFYSQELPPADNAVAAEPAPAALMDNESHPRAGVPHEGMRISVRDAAEIALRQNLKLRQQWEAIGEAEARLREKQNEYGPRLQFDYTFWTWHGIFVTPVAADPDIPVEGTGRAEMTLFLPVWTARQSRDMASKQALEEVKVRKADFEVKRAQVAAEVVKKYFAVLEADEAVQATREAVTLNEERVRMLKVLEREGKVLKNKVLLGEKFLASAKEEAQFRKTEREIAALRLRRLLRIPDALPVTLLRPAGMAPEPPTAQDAVARSKADSPLLKRLDHEQQSAYYAGRVRAYEEPRAHIALRYGVSFPEYKEFTDDFATIGLTVNWPTGKCRLDRAKRDQARHKVAQLQLEREIVGEQLDLDVREAHAAYVKSLRRVESRELAVALAEENLRLSRVYAEHGQTDTQEPEDVFQSSVNAIALSEARMELTKVRYETYGFLADLFARMNAVDELVYALVNPAPPRFEEVPAAGE